MKKSVKKKSNKKRKLNKKKVFCAISIGFLVGCCLFYGIRFISLYIEHNKVSDNDSDILGQVVKLDNFGEDYFKNINNSFYFSGDVDNNYVLYSNILWRIVKLEKDDSLLLISDSSLSSLAFSNEISDYTSSYINEWLNASDDEYTGILENNLNEVETYLAKQSICLDTSDKATNEVCKDTKYGYYLSLLTMADYVNTGASKGFINDGNYFYMSTLNSKNEVWTVGDKLSTSDGTDIYGVRPTIVLNNSVKLISGNGSKDDPYVIEKKSGLFGSYVELDGTMWRVYQQDENKVKLVMSDYIKSDGNNLEYNYSTTGYMFNDTRYQSAAYYINNTFLNSLSYKEHIEEVEWSNGYYGADNDYDYKDALSTTVPTKVAMLSIGDVILTEELSDFYTMTGTTKNGSLVYTISNNSIYPSSSEDENYLVPTISLDKDLLKSGSGTKKDPYGLE